MGEKTNIFICRIVITSAKHAVDLLCISLYNY